MSQPVALPPVIKIEDASAFLKENKLQAVKVWWSGRTFVMGVMDADEPPVSTDKGGVDRK